MLPDQEMMALHQRKTMKLTLSRLKSSWISRRSRHTSWSRTTSRVRKVVLLNLYRPDCQRTAGHIGCVLDDQWWEQADPDAWSLVLTKAEWGQQTCRFTTEASVIGTSSKRWHPLSDALTSPQCKQVGSYSAISSELKFHCRDGKCEPLVEERLTDPIASHLRCWRSFLPTLAVKVSKRYP
jgi:hypothetical protein